MDLFEDELNMLLDSEGRQHLGHIHESSQPPGTHIHISTPRVTPPITRVTTDAQDFHLPATRHTPMIQVCRATVGVNVTQQEQESCKQPGGPVTSPFSAHPFASPPLKRTALQGFRLKHSLPSIYPLATLVTPKVSSHPANKLAEHEKQQSTLLHVHHCPAVIG